MDALASFFGRQGLLPHGAGLSWAPPLLWAMVAADMVLAAACFSVPFAILHFVRQRGPLPKSWVPMLLCAFALACGVSQVMDLWALWQPGYGLQPLGKTVSAVLAIVTVVALWRLMPQALKTPARTSCRPPWPRWKPRPPGTWQPSGSASISNKAWPSRWPASTPVSSPPTSKAASLA